MKTLKLYMSWAYSTLFGVLYEYEYCSVWDNKLNELIDRGDCSLGYKTLKFSNTEVWLANKFYSYGYIYNSDITPRRPSIKTMFRLHNIHTKLLNDSKKIEIEEYVNKMSKL